MGYQERVTLSQTECQRVTVVQRLVDELLTVEEAAMLLGLSRRQVKRLKARFRRLGVAGLVHGNRGRRPAHAIPEALRQQVVELAQTKYRGCNDTFLRELLREYEGITLSPSSVRRILRAAGIPSPRKHRPPKRHRRRPRKPQRGMLVLIDGSDHDWLEGRGPRLVLLAAVDDATGEILAALFCLSENFEGYCRLLRELVVRYGIPLAVYSDRHTLSRCCRPKLFCSRCFTVFRGPPCCGSEAAGQSVQTSDGETKWGGREEPRPTLQAVPSCCRLGRSHMSAPGHPIKSPGVLALKVLRSA